MARAIVSGLVVLFLAACGGDGGDEAAGWRAEIAFTAPDKLGGLAVGDIDATRPGVEIATVCRNGDVYLVTRTDGAWTHERLATHDGEMLHCAIGDVDPRAPGPEIVAVGMNEGDEEDGGAGAIHVISRGEAGWRTERVHLADALVHGVCVADLDPDREGMEILGVGFDRKAVLVYRDGDGWGREVVADLAAKGKNAVPYRGGAAIATGAGRVEHLRKADGAWVLETLFASEAGQARLGTDGSRVLSAGDDGALTLVDGKTSTAIHREGAKLRGAVLADLDPATPGLEAATAGYETRMTVLTLSDGAWRAETVFTDTGRFHHLGAGDILPGTGGVELAGCGYSKRVVVVSRR